MPQLLSLVTRAVSDMFGKGNFSAVTLTQKHDLKLDVFGDPTADITDVFKDGHEFVCLLHREQNVVTIMNQLRHKIFFQREEHPKE